jgi:hypothetical protein
MASLWKLAMVSALIGLLAFAATADAHTLKVPRAASANKTFAKLVCGAVEDEATCEASQPGGCHRLSKHRVRCIFFTTLKLEDGSRSRCESLIDWSIRGTSPSLHPHFLGTRTCTELTPPTVEEPPAP